ncbi:MAG: methyltransferase domain-containing protein [Alphaproteobacteria bacterium]
MASSKRSSRVQRPAQPSTAAAAKAELLRRFEAAQALRSAGKLLAAIRAYRAILKDRPRHLGAIRGLAAALAARGRTDEAFEQRARARRIEAYNLMRAADRLVEAEQPAKGAALLKRATRLDPKRPLAHWYLAEALSLLGKRKAALASYQRFHALAPNDPEGPHMIAAHGGTVAPMRASDDYIVEHFDRFAERFDQTLVEDLGYRAPHYLRQALVAEGTLAKGRKLDILDLGCGTGLCGLEIRRWARRLHGIDLSRAMLAKARRRKIYHSLKASEITACLGTTAETYDLVVSSDVLIYFGDLSPVFTGVARVLRDGGRFAFSVEQATGPKPVLTTSGRYAHGRVYLRKALSKAGLSVASITTTILRKEYDVPVKGLVVVARKR